MEPDQRHVDLIVKDLGLSDARPVSTPGESESRDEEAECSKPLSSEDAIKCRGLAARANDLASGGTDIMYSEKEMSSDGHSNGRRDRKAVHSGAGIAAGTGVDLPAVGVDTHVIECCFDALLSEVSIKKRLRLIATLFEVELAPEHHSVCECILDALYLSLSCKLCLLFFLIVF